MLCVLTRYRKFAQLHRRLEAYLRAQVCSMGVCEKGNVEVQWNQGETQKTEILRMHVVQFFHLTRGVRIAEEGDANISA